MTIERIAHSGGWQATATVNGYLMTRTFYGYTKREAATLFRAELVKWKKREGQVSAHLSTFRRGWEQAEREWATAFRREGYDTERAAEGYERAAALLERADRGGWEWSPLAWVARAEILGILGTGVRIDAATLRDRGAACRARVDR